MLETDRKSYSWLIGNIGVDNLAPSLPESVVAALGPIVVSGFDIDVASRKTWEDATNEGLKIAMQERESKTSPWPGCANVKHPLMATAAIQFASRAYPEIVKGADVVKSRVIGADPNGEKEKRGKRVAGHMSYQCLEEMPEWEEDTDKLLHSLPIMGLYYRKTYRDDLLRRNVSVCRSPLEIVVNNKAKSILTARRVTDAGVWLYKNEVLERERAGLFTEGTAGRISWNDDEKDQQQFLEQHCFADLDGDGYEEPYIITVHKDTSLVARIVARYDAEGVIPGRNGEVARIDPVHYFTKFPFLPAPDGSFHDLGFAQLLGPLNEVINTLINQLLDSGTLANLGGGFIGKGIRWQGGVMRFVPGEWKPVDVGGGVLKENIVPLPVKDPSNVLFTLLGALTEATDRLASVSEAMTGEYPSQNTPATTVIAMIEQGLKVFTSIYKRVFRSLKSEYKKLFRLNRIYMAEEEYYMVADTPEAVFRTDYDEKGVDILPVADPTISSEAQRMARGRAIMETLTMNPTMGGKIEILTRYYEALDTPNIDKLLPQAEIDKILNAPPPPDPKLIEVQMKTLQAKHDYEMAEDKLELERQKLSLEREKVLAEIELSKANAIKAIAEAEAKEVGQQFELYRHEVEQLNNRVEIALKMKDQEIKEKTLEAKEKQNAAPSGDTA